MVKTWVKPYTEDFNTYAKLIAEIVSLPEEYCLSITGAKATVYASAVFAKKAITSSVKFSFLNTKGSFKLHHSILGFTRKSGYRCSYGGVTVTVSAASYPTAIEALKTKFPDSFTEYAICTMFGSKTGEVFISKQKAERSTDSADSAIVYTGKVSTGSPVNSFVDGQLEYLYGKFAGVEKEELHLIQKLACQEKRSQWLTEHAELTINSRLYFASRSENVAGYIKDLTATTWPCMAIRTFRITEELTGNCSERTRIAFKLPGKPTELVGYVDRLTGAISQEPGHSIPCESKDHILSIGRGMLVRYNVSGNYLLTQDLEVRDIETDLVERENDFIDLGEMTEERGLLQRVETLAEVVFNNVQNGILEPAQLENRSESQVMTDIKGVNWNRIFGFDMEAIFHVMVAVFGIALGVVALVLFCKMKKWWNDCAGSDSNIQESTRRHWSRVRAGLRGRRTGGDLEGGYRHIGIPLPEMPDIADVAGPEVPAVLYSCGVQGNDGRVSLTEEPGNELASTDEKKRPDTRTVKLQTPE